MQTAREKANAYAREWRKTHKTYVARREYLRHGPEGLTAAHLRLILSYDADTGLFTWLIPNCMRMKPGDRAGCANGKTGYVEIHIQGKKYKAHRLAWMYVYGAWPLQDIDHINGVPGDNRIANLRDVSRTVNSQNQRRPKSGNPALGVTKTRNGKYQSVIWVPSTDGSKQYIFLGTFLTADDGHAAYLEAKRRLHEGCTI